MEILQGGSLSQTPRSPSAGEEKLRRETLDGKSPGRRIEVFKSIFSIFPTEKLINY